GPPLIAANDGYAGKLLFGGWAFYSTGTPSMGAARIVWPRARGVSANSGKFYLDVDAGEAPEPGQAGASHHQHFFLVVLQQHRGKRSGWHCIVRSVSRCPVPVAGLDLQS